MTAPMTIKLCWTKAGTSYMRAYPARKVDTYGFEVKTYRRHPKCSCKIPCQARFCCEAGFHRGRRATPYCHGCMDDEPGYCDTCWNIKHSEHNQRKTA